MNERVNRDEKGETELFTETIFTEKNNDDGNLERKRKTYSQANKQASEKSINSERSEFYG